MFKIVIILAAIVVILAILLHKEMNKLEKKNRIYEDRYEYAQRFISNNGLMEQYRASIAEDKKFWGEELFG